MDVKELKSNLRALGLSKNETTVYLALLRLGVSQAGPLVKATALHRMLVYEALDDLERKGLITVVRKKNIKMFQASDPSVLLEQTRRLTGLAQLLVPELRHIRKQIDPVEIRTLVGREGYITNLTEVVESARRQKNKLICIIGGARDTDAYDIVGDWYDDYVALLKKKSVKKRLLAPEPFSQEFKKKFVREKNTELCTLPHGLSSPTYTRMTHEMVTIEVLKPSIVIIQIRNKAVARSYLDAFNLLWKQLHRKQRNTI
jgi:sugar-specific transcriptional regulator TrmB